MTAEQIIANMIDVYILAPSYRDSGRVVTNRIYPEGGWGRPPSAQVFKTAFVRPNRLRFETWLVSSQKRIGHSIAWADGQDIRRWRQRTSISQRVGTLRQALLPTLAPAVRYVQPVFSLLIPDEIGEWYLTNLTALRPLADESLDGHACYRLQARCSWWDQELSQDDKQAVESVLEELARLAGEPLPSGRSINLPLTLWIDRDSLLVRRLESRHLEDRYAVDVVVTYEPEVGCMIPESELQFDPPEQEHE